MVARIYKPAKTAMQSGTAKTKEWVLDYEPEQPRAVEPLMGWTSSGDMRQQLQTALRHERGSGRLLRAPWHRLSGCRAEGGRAEDDVVLGQLRLQPARLLDALSFAAADGPGRVRFVLRRAPRPRSSVG